MVFACYRDSSVTGLDISIPRAFGLIICMEDDKNYQSVTSLKRKLHRSIQNNENYNIEKE